MKQWRLLLILLSSLFLAACGPVATPPVSSYTLTNLQTAHAPAHTVTHSSLLVSNPVASPGYQTAAMIYMITPYELKAFANNRWVAPPAQMLLPLLVQAVRNTGYFSAVVSPPFAGITDYHLDTQLLKLQQEFLLPNSVVRLSVQASLISSHTSQVVASRLFEVVVVAQTNNPYGGVLAANQAAAIISNRIAKFCMRYAH
jgi:cholesterol transport system auxiliary component